MLIVFGIRHFKIKSYAPSEFGLNDPSWSTTRFEAVQKYFHLIYIPFFPVGKMIGTRGADGELYHLDPRIEEHINTYQLQHKTPWYAFFGPILAIAIVLFLGINSKIADHNRAQNAEEQYLKYKTKVLQMIGHPSLFDYYSFSVDTNGGEREYSSRQITVVYRVVDFNDKAIQFISSEEDPFINTYDTDYAGWIAYFNDSANYNPTWIQKADLKKAVLPSHEQKYSYAGAKVVMFGKSRLIRIEDAQLIEGPEFSAYYNSISQNEVSILINNIADTARDISFTKISGEGEWTLEAGDVITPSEVFYLKSNKISENFSGKLECFDMRGKPHSFIISGKSETYLDLEVKKVR